MGWGIAGGVVGILLMIGAYKWLTSWAGAHQGGTYISTIGSRPRRLAGVPEEAPPDAIAPPAMEVLRYNSAPVVIPPDTTSSDTEVDNSAAAEQPEGDDLDVETSPDEDRDSSQDDV